MTIGVRPSRMEVTSADGARRGYGPGTRPRPKSAGSATGGRRRPIALLPKQGMNPEIVTGVMGPEWTPAEAEGNWQRAEIRGRAKVPRLGSDRAKLIELFSRCREANFREVRALVMHFPYLLQLTDESGFTALHYAQLSGDAEFTAQLLDLYHEPRNLARKYVRYERPEQLRADGLVLERGLLSESQAPRCRTGSSGRLSRSGGGRRPMSASAAGRPGSERRPGSARATPRQKQPALARLLAGPGGALSLSTAAAAEDEFFDTTVVVRHVPQASMALQAGVVPTDVLESVESKRHTLTLDEVVEITDGGGSLEVCERGFPLTLEFRGPACAEILFSDGWTPLHSAAGGGASKNAVLQLLLSEQQGFPVKVQDAKGLTPEHWKLLGRRGGDRKQDALRSRPLSAGPGVRRPPRPLSAARSAPSRGGPSTSGTPLARGPPLRSGNGQGFDVTLPKGAAMTPAAPHYAEPDVDLLPPAPPCLAEIPCF